MLRIRFFRKGRKKQPFFKIVVTDKNNPPSSGRFVEEVGFYNPHTKECKIEGEKVTFWMEKGAQPSDVVWNLLIKEGLIKGEKRNVVSLTKKRRAKIEEKQKKDEVVVEKEVEEMVEVTKESAVEEVVEESASEKVEESSKEETTEESFPVEEVKEDTTEEEVKEKNSPVEEEIEEGVAKEEEIKEEK
jgi:small subunit ribosomal protein S16